MIALLAQALLTGLPVEEGIAYSEPEPGVALTLDYYPGAGPAPHPAVVLIHGGGFVAGTSRSHSEVYCAGFLAPAGYSVFAINYRLAPDAGWREMTADVARAVRFVRHNARRWSVDPARIGLVGGSSGGYLANMAGLLGGPGQRGAKDLVDREPSTVAAVVSLFSLSDFRGRAPEGSVRTLLAPDIERDGEERAAADASPVMHMRPDAPPYLLIHGDRDETAPLTQSTHWQNALQSAGVRCDLMIIAGGGHGTGDWHRIPGVREWEREMVEWLNRMLGRRGVAAFGVRERDPSNGPSIAP